MSQAGGSFDHHGAHRAILASDLPSSARHVLHALVVHASADGLAWPSQGTLHAETGLGERTVRRVLQRLRQGGVLEPRGRPNRSITYLIRTGHMGRRADAPPSSPGLVEGPEPATLAVDASLDGLDASGDPATMAGLTGHPASGHPPKPGHHGQVNRPNDPSTPGDPATMAGITGHIPPSEASLPGHLGQVCAGDPATMTGRPGHHGRQTVHEQSIREEEEGPLTGGGDPATEASRESKKAPTTSDPVTRPSVPNRPSGHPANPATTPATTRTSSTATTTRPTTPSRPPTHLGDFGAIAAWWAKGIAEGQGFPCSTPGRPDDLRELSAVCTAHAVTAEGARLEGAPLHAWVQESACLYAKTTPATYWGRNIRRWATWEDSGRPAEPVRAAGTVRRGDIVQPVTWEDDLADFEWGRSTT